VTLETERLGWRSPHTGVTMTVVRYGRTGQPVLYLPSSGGDHDEFGRYKMPEVCRPWLEAGRLQVFAADARGPQTLFNAELPTDRRMAEYARVERYFVEELLPRLATATDGARLTLIGCSYGAFVAANLLFKHPERVNVACGLGGVYEMWHRLDGHHDDDVYAHTPLEYLPHLEDPAVLAGIRATGGFDLYAAARDSWLDETRQLAAIMARKALPHRVWEWPAPADHHESWWRRQLGDFLARTFPLRT
jgi:esterase/lipase superfamily enzyme